MANLQPITRPFLLHVDRHYRSVSALPLKMMADVIEQLQHKNIVLFHKVDSNIRAAVGRGLYVLIGVFSDYTLNVWGLKGPELMFNSTSLWACNHYTLLDFAHLKWMKPSHAGNLCTHRFVAHWRKTRKLRAEMDYVACSDETALKKSVNKLDEMKRTK